VLGADTIVVIDGLILGKPKNQTQARKMLQKLSGREHKVFTGLLLLMWPLKFTKRKSFNPPCALNDQPQEMDWYVSCDEPYDKAGDTLCRGKAPTSSNHSRLLYKRDRAAPLRSFGSVKKI